MFIVKETITVGRRRVPCLQKRAPSQKGGGRKPALLRCWEAFNDKALSLCYDVLQRFLPWTVLVWLHGQRSEISPSAVPFFCSIFARQDSLQAFYLLGCPEFLPCVL